jgi:beta-lactamase class A
MVPDIEERWRQFARETDGTVGAAALNLRSGRMASLNGKERFPLASVCKLPIALNILAQVDEGKLSLNQNIEIPLYDVVPSVSPIAERWQRQKSFPLRDLVSLMIAKSDNTAVQTLFRLSGGQAGMAERFRKWKIAGMRVDRSERRCNLDAAGVRNIPPVSEWTPRVVEDLMAAIAPRERQLALRRFLDDPRDTGTPDGTVHLLKRLFTGELLSKEMTSYLVKTLESTTTGKARIKGMLPPGTVVAHKTGTTSTVMGLNGATNDVGVVTLPNGAGRLAIAVYIKASTRDEAARDSIIARIARTAFDSLS